MRRKRGPWMNKASDPVLEFLDDHEIAVPTSVLDIELEASRATISRAVSDLEKYGLIEAHPEYTTHYRITKKGRAYLEGDLDASELEDPVSDDE